MGTLTSLGALRMVDHAAWALQVRRAMQRAGGRIPEAARILGVGWRTLHRWLADPAFARVERAPRGPAKKVAEKKPSGRKRREG